MIETIARIPKGKVSTYGRIAELAGWKGYARHVGYLLKNLPPNSTLPWHRVLNASGRSSFVHGSERYQEQINRLQTEGIPVLNARVNLGRYLW